MDRSPIRNSATPYKGGIGIKKGSKNPAKRKPVIGLNPAKQVSPKFMKKKQPVKVVTSGTKKKSHTIKRTKMGRMGKQEGQAVVFKAFMA